MLKSETNNWSHFGTKRNFIYNYINQGYMQRTKLNKETEVVGRNAVMYVRKIKCDKIEVEKLILCNQKM